MTGTMYCTKCGSQLEDEYFFHHFDKLDGTKVYVVKSKCPNRRHIFDGHTSEWRRDSWGYMNYFYNYNGKRKA